MKTTQLNQFKKWFKNYTSRFFKDDAFVNANLKLKEHHTHRVCKEIDYLTDQLELTQSQALIAQTIALFHDVGRYEQFTRYRTFADKDSTPHGPLAVQILQKQNVLDNLNISEQIIIKKAIALHSIKKLPPNLPTDILLFAGLIRDADKLDIYRIVADVDDLPQAKTREKLLINWFPKGDDYSKEMIRAVLNREHIDYSTMKTHNDMKILHLAWVYDLNFKPTFQKIKNRKYLEKIIEMLPKTHDIQKVATQVIAHVTDQAAEN